MITSTQSVSNLLFVVGRGPDAWVVTLQGHVIRTFTNSQEDRAAFITTCLSSSGKLAYLGTENGKVQCIDLLTQGLGLTDGPSSIEDSFQALDRQTESGSASSSSKKARVASEILGLVHHPHRNLVASFANDGILKLWRP